MEFQINYDFLRKNETLIPNASLKKYTAKEIITTMSLSDFQEENWPVYMEQHPSYKNSFNNDTSKMEVYEEYEKEGWFITINTIEELMDIYHKCGEENLIIMKSLDSSYESIVPYGGYLD